MAAPTLRPGFYTETCPQAEFIVKDVMKKAMKREPRSLASVMRLQFHDCFVNVIVNISRIHFFVAVFENSCFWVNFCFIFLGM